MSGVLVQNQDWSPAQGTGMDLTTACDHSKDVAIYCNTPRSNIGYDTSSNTGSGVNL